MTDRFCRGSREYFSDRLDRQRLPFWRGLLVGVHLTICPQCRRFNRSLVAAKDALQSLRDAELDR